MIKKEDTYEVPGIYWLIESTQLNTSCDFTTSHMRGLLQSLCKTVFKSFSKRPRTSLKTLAITINICSSFGSD